MSDQAAFQEIDDAVRQDDLKAWWSRWGTYVVAAAVLAVVAATALVGWRQYDASRRATAGAAYSASITKIASDPKAARTELEQQATSAPEPYRSLAALAAAQLLDTPDQQIAALIALAPKLTPEMSDLALAMAGYRSVDAGKLDAMAGQFEAMTGPERPFRVSARELQALALVKKGDIKGARTIWEEIGKATDGPPGAAQRAAAMLTIYPAPAEAK
ncbi:MAG: tetratricopeptide repeat protein [Proteobacteria bacterium]|nr:tetratricopeptide repeat protein [Pseudomonadota bacterium]